MSSRPGYTRLTIGDNDGVPDVPLVNEPERFFQQLEGVASPDIITILKEFISRYKWENITNTTEWSKYSLSDLGYGIVDILQKDVWWFHFKALAAAIFYLNPPNEVGFSPAVIWSAIDVLQSTFVAATSWITNSKDQAAKDIQAELFKKNITASIQDLKGYIEMLQLGRDIDIEQMKSMLDTLIKQLMQTLAPTIVNTYNTYNTYSTSQPVPTVSAESIKKMLDTLFKELVPGISAEIRNAVINVGIRHTSIPFLKGFSVVTGATKKEGVVAEYYPKSQSAFLHPRRPYWLGNGGPMQTYAGVGFNGRG